jgi:hypothetical protein
MVAAARKNEVGFLTALGKDGVLGNGGNGGKNLFFLQRKMV